MVLRLLSFRYILAFENRLSCYSHTCYSWGSPDANYEGNVKNTQNYKEVQLSDRSIEILNEEIELNKNKNILILIIKIIVRCLLLRVFTNPITMGIPCITVF